MQTREIDLVGEFHRKMRIVEPCDPMVPTHEVAMRHLGLIIEELAELCRAIASQNSVEILDALVDMQYVTCGAMRMSGIKEAWDWKNGGHGTRIGDWTAIMQVQQDICMLTRAIIMCDVRALEHAFCMLNIGISNLFCTLGFEAVRERAFQIVHESNMTKTCDFDGWSGKILKGENYVSPDLHSLIH